MTARLRPSRRRTIASLAGAGAAAAALAVVGIGGPAGAVSNPDYTVPPPPTTIVTDTTPDEPISARQVTTAVEVEQVRTSLAITGSDLNLAAVLGATSVAAGAGIMVARRRAASA